jgi:aminodeoxyfutalosine synthase
MMMDLGFMDHNLYAIRDKVLEEKRLSFEDGLLLYNSHDLSGIGRLADIYRKQRHGKKAYYVVNQHLNYTNVCINRCVFCAFARDEGQAGAFTLSPDQVKEKLSVPTQKPVREIHMVGGLNPSLSFDYYLDLIRIAHKLRPLATIKAFTAVEIDYFSRISGLSIEETIQELKAVGLGMIPGGGAEVMSERIREKLFPKKLTTKDGLRLWLQCIKPE